MWGHRSFMDPMGHNMQRGFATYAVEKMVFKTTTLPRIDNIMNISPNKRFTNPNYVNKHNTTLSEQCANFINNYNGYPNNMRKEHVEAKHKKKRKNHNKYTLGMDIKEDIDEVGVDVVNDSTCITEPQPAHGATLEDFIPTKELIVSLPSSPIQIKISAGYSISPNICSMSPAICSVSSTYCSMSISPGASSKLRRMSDCNSDIDVIFEGGDDSCTESEWSDDDEDDEDTGDESDFIDFNDNSCKNTPKTEYMMSVPITTKKKVRFADDKDLVQVHKMCAWSYAYRASRKGNWDQYARDRERFQRRIDECAVNLGRILRPEHRLSIYRQRFEVDDT